MESRTFFFWFLTLLLVFVFQISFSDAIAVRGIFPNLMLLQTIFFAIYSGPIVGQFTGFLCGLLSDVASISIFGSQTFMFTLVGYLSGQLQGKINEEKPIAQMALVLVMSALYVLGLLFFETLFGGFARRFKVQISVFQPLYTTLISPVFFLFLYRCRALLFRQGVRR